MVSLRTLAASSAVLEGTAHSVTRLTLSHPELGRAGFLLVAVGADSDLQLESPLVSPNTDQTLLLSQQLEVGD